MENLSWKARKFNIRIEGVQVQSFAGEFSVVGGWKAYTYNVTVSDSELNVLLDYINGDTHLMGLEIDQYVFIFFIFISISIFILFILNIF